MKAPYYDLSCKYCNSNNIIKYGKFRGVQRFYCKDCKSKFADNDALPHMQTPIEQVGTAIGMYYEGQSLNSIRRLLAQIYNNYPSDSTIYRWVSKFSKIAVNEVKDYKKPDVGDVWIADETVLRVDNSNLWFWDIIDSKTRFLLASHVSKSRNISDAKQLMESASKRAGKTPKIVITDRLASYVDGIEQAFGADAEHIQSKPFTIRNSTNLIERFHGTLKSRTKVMRGLKELRTARLFTDGWLVHYNYLRPHESLKDKTPAEVAGVKYPYRNWQDVVAKRRIITPKSITSLSSATIPPVIELPTHTRSSSKIARKKVKKQRTRPTIAGISGVR